MFDFKELNQKVPNIQYLTLAGSKSYGTNNKNSDTDIRGFYLETPKQLLGVTQSNDEYTNTKDDIIVFAFRKFLSLLTNCNPNVVELLGTREQDVIHMTEVAKYMRDNYDMFLSKRAHISFTGYATQQLRRLQNALGRANDDIRERHIYDSLRQEIYHNQENLKELGEYKITLEDEVMASIHVDHVPLRKLLQANSTLKNTIRNYDKIGHRNHKKDDNHLYKHAMHLIRLYYMGIDILEKGEINTYREKEHDLFMTIRNGEMPFDEVFALRDKLDARIAKSLENSKLPEYCDMERVNNFCIKVLGEHLNETGY